MVYTDAEKLRKCLKNTGGMVGSKNLLFHSPSSVNQIRTHYARL